MAKPPPDATFQKTDYPETGLGSAKALDKFFKTLNAHTQGAQSALNGKLTFGQNVNAEVKTFNVKTPMTDWTAVTLNTGWTNLGGVDPPAQYRKDACGTVFIEGTVVHSGTGTAFTLPADYFPGPTLSFITYVNTSGTEQFARLEIAENGDVSINLNSPTTAGVINCSFVSASRTPGVLSCFPVTVATTVPSPIGVHVLAVADTSAAPSVPAIGGLSWTPLSAGQIRLDNLSGLLLGRTYTITVVILGG